MDTGSSNGTSAGRSSIEPDPHLTSGSLNRVC